MLETCTTSPKLAEPTECKKLSVAIVSTQKEFNGGERQCRLLAMGLRERGHDVSILARAGEEFASRMYSDRFRVFQFPGRGRSPVGLYRNRQALAQIRPDVVHFNDGHAMTSGGLACCGLGIPVRIASRRVDFPVRSGFRYHLLADHVICVSSAVRNACKAAGIDEGHLSVVHDGVEPSSFLKANGKRLREELRIDNTTEVILNVAKLTECKGHRYLLEAMSKVIQKRPNAVLLCAGNGPMFEMLQNQARSMNLTQHVRLLGFRHDIPDLLAAADLMVVASHTEGLCSSIIDAMISGCPVVGTDAGGIPDLLNWQGHTLGWQVPARNSDALAAKIMDALSNQRLRHERTTRANQIAMQSLTHDSMVENTICVYEKIMNKSLRMRKAG